MPNFDLIPIEVSVPVEQNIVLSLFFLFFLVLLTVFVLLQRGHFFMAYLGGMFSTPKMNKYIEDQHVPSYALPFPMLSFGLSFFLSGVVIYWFLWDLIDHENYIISAFLIALLFGFLPYIHHYVIRISGMVFKLPNYAEKQTLIASYSLDLATFLSIPLFLYFLNTRSVDTNFVNIYFIVLGILVAVYYIVRTFTLFNKRSFVVWFYIFVYLCTLEVVPLLLIVKVIAEIYS